MLPLENQRLNRLLTKEVVLTMLLTATVMEITITSLALTLEIAIQVITILGGGSTYKKYIGFIR